MALKRTRKHGYNLLERLNDLEAAQEAASKLQVNPDMHPMVRAAKRRDRNERYEERRLLNARKSGIGRRECERRAARM